MNLPKDTEPSPATAAERPKRVYRPPISPGLRVFLVLVLGLFALLAANSVYLVAIRYMEWSTEQVWQNYFYIQMFLLHLVLGIALIIPLFVFIGGHLRRVYKNRNRRAVQAGYALMIFSIILVASGILLTRVDGFPQINDAFWRSALFVMHVAAPLAIVWMYVLHRLAGRPIRWKIGAGWLVATSLAIGLIIASHHHDPRAWNVTGPKSGEAYFFPSLSRTSTGNFIPAESLTNDEYCKECHTEAHKTWMHSAHHLSSFNNPAYLFSVQNTRREMMKRDGSVQGARFCAGCHDPVPFFSGAFDQPHFDDPEYDLRGDPFAQAGITCTACHAISNINDKRGNGSYTIDEPINYPFTTSDNFVLKWVSRQLVKAKPEFHKKTYLKPLHRTTEFCGSCHKVHLPEELNGFRWLRGQNHYDTFWLSGVSGHNVESFYYPPVAEQNCNKCHMPLKEVVHSVQTPNFAAQARGPSGELMTFDHQFPSANTALPWMLRGEMEGCIEAINNHAEFNRDIVRVDLFGLREDGRIDGKLVAPLDSVDASVEPGKTYLLETVIRTLKLGHTLTQGTADSNEIWLEMEVRNGDRVIGRSGGIDPQSGTVDPWSHFGNAFVIDKNGNRINRRNAEDIFVALYDNQIPPGAADSLHFKFVVPEDATGTIEVRARLRYRKFDTEYMRLVMQATAGVDPETYRNDLPIMNLAAASVVIPVDGTGNRKAENEKRDIPLWQRWNDYGIGLLRRGKLRQAEEAFRQVESLGVPDGAINLARVYINEGRVIEEAPAALKRSREVKTEDGREAPEWTLLWLSGLVNKQNGDNVAAISSFEQIVEGGFRQAAGRGFDFSRDYRLLNELADTCFIAGESVRGENGAGERSAYFSKAEGYYLRALAYDPENATAHYGLKRIYERTGEPEKAEFHSSEHQKYKLDDNLRDSAVQNARRKYPAANHAAERSVIYDLQREEAFPVPEPRNDSRSVGIEIETEKR